MNIPYSRGAFVEEPEGGAMGNVVVAALLEGGPAQRASDKVRVGDIIRLVDGQQVTVSTVEQLLSTYTSSTKVKLTIQRPAQVPGNRQPPLPLPPSSTQSSSVEDYSGSERNLVVEEGTGASLSARMHGLMTDSRPAAREVQARLKRTPFVVMYVTR